ncbi:hypothetical protein [Flavobacterium sp. FlaQc-50]|uniref:hypothetical protein n=1 Tax=unclassified Flavobacterium TaxID=196869 RepID=UPI003757EC2E
MFNQEKYHLREAAITTAAVGLGMAGLQAYQGAENKRKGQKALQDYDRQDLAGSNAYKGIPISTVGSDLLREETQRTSANTVDAIRNMGTRGASLLPGVISANNRANRDSRNYLDDQVIKREYAIAGDEGNIRSLTEDRENADLAGIGNQIQVGRQDMWSGIRGLGNSAMYAINNNDWKGTDPASAGKGWVNPIGTINPDLGYKLPDFSKLYKTGF